jgi:rod shape-determining protein MreD
MKVARLFLVVLLALTLQTSLVSQLHTFGATGDIMLLLGIAAGIAGGAETGALVGFGAGLTFDLMLQSPFGLSALAYCLTGYVVGTFQGSVLRATWWIPMSSALIASALGTAVFALVGEVLGQESYVSLHLLAIIGVVSVLNAFLAPVAVRAMRWALGASTSQPRLALR